MVGLEKGKVKSSAPAPTDNGLFRLMSVDDEPIVHRALEQIVRESELPIELAGSAHSATEALQLAKEIKPEICLLDIHMAGMDGLELACQLNLTLEQQPRIIYLTAYDHFEYAQRAIRIGAVDFLLKPIKRAEVVNALKTAVNMLQAERIKRLEDERLLQRFAAVAPALSKETPRPTASRSASLVREVQKYIEEHYAEHISLATVSEYLHLSTQYLGSLFKAEGGIAFRAYLRATRIMHAKELMCDPRLNLTEVALAVGYEDLNSFSQAFLKETGMRPSEYHGEGRRWAK